MLLLAVTLLGVTVLGWGFAIFAAPTAPRLIQVSYAGALGLILVGLSVMASGLTQIYEVRYYVAGTLLAISIWLGWRSERNAAGNAKTPWALLLLILAASAPMLLNARAAARGLPAEWVGWRTFYQDHFAQIGWVAETIDRAPSDYPWVAGVELHYTWLYHASIGFLSDISGLTADVMVSQVWPYIYALLFVALFGWLAWQISGGRLPVVAIAFVLTIAFDSPLGLVGMRAVQPIASVSPTRDFGNLIILLTLIAVLEWLPRWTKANATNRIGFGLLILTLGFAGHAGKGSALIVLLGAIGFAWLISLIVSKKNSVPLFITGISLTAGAALAQLLVVKSSHYLTIDPLTFIGGDKTLWKLALIILAVMIAQLAFVAVAMNQSTVTHQVAIAALLGGGIAGVLGLTIFGHPGTSQRYFYYNSYPLVAIGLGIGVLVLADRFGKRIYVWTSLVLATAWYYENLNPTAANKTDLTNTVTQRIVLIVAISWVTLALVTIFKWRSTHPKHFLLILLASSIAIQGTVSLSTYKFSEATKRANPRAISSEQVEALRYIRTNSQAKDLVANNRHCRSGSIATNDCYPIWFPVSAYAERQVLVEGFSYTWLTSGEALEDVFWDKNRLQINDDFYQSPTLTNCRQMQKFGVRWVYVDRRFTTGNLGSVTTKRFENADAAVYEITNCK